MFSFLRNIGLVCLVAAILTFLMACFAFFSEGIDVTLAFGQASASFLFLGLLLSLSLRKNREITVEIATATAFFGWVLFSVAAALPFWWAAGGDWLPEHFQDFSNCLFEGTSAATSAGLTVVVDSSELPASFQLWRSVCQWAGGIGVLVLAIAFVEWGEGDRLVYRAVARSKTLEDNIRGTTRAVLKVHLLLTLVVFLLFGVLGMPWWEALNHSLTTTSTGGFTMNGGGAGDYSRGIQGIMILGMIAGAISFVSHYRVLFLRKFSAWFSTAEHRLFYVLLLMGMILAPLLESEVALFDRVFLWVSGLTTTGYSTVDPGRTGNGFMLLLMIGMFVGAMAGSTAGGVKISRLLGIGRRLKAKVSPSSASGIEELNEAQPEQSTTEDRMPLVLFILWLATAATGTVALLWLADAEDFGIRDHLFEVLSAMGCVGLSSGLTSAELTGSPKILLCFLMWLGRIELISFFVATVISTKEENCEAYGISSRNDRVS